MIGTPEALYSACADLFQRVAVPNSWVTAHHIYRYKEGFGVCCLDNHYIKTQPYGIAFKACGFSMMTNFNMGRPNSFNVAGFKDR